MKKKRMVAMLGLMAFSSAANAQWAVTNVDDPIYFSPTGIFTQTLGMMIGALKASIDQGNSLAEVRRKQAMDLVQNADVRQRAAMGIASMAKTNANLMPTIEQCVELTKREAGSYSNQYASYGGSGFSSIPVNAQKMQLTSDSKKLSMALSQKNALGTCSQLDVSAGLDKCSTVGDYGGDQSGKSTIPGSDVSYLSLKGDTNNSDKLNGTGQELANYTISTTSKGVDVANQYIANSTLYAAPKMLPPNQLKAHPDYVAAYDQVMVKLNAAQQAMKDVLSLRIAPGSWPSQGAAYTDWQTASSNYKTLFGMNPPKVPSVEELMNYKASNDYLGVPSDTAQTQEDILKSIDRKLALNNFILMKQFNQQENMSILLSMILTQEVTPANMETVNAEYSRIMNSH